MSDIGKELASFLRLSAEQALAGELERVTGGPLSSTASGLVAESGPEKTSRDVAYDMLAALQAFPRSAPSASTSSGATKPMPSASSETSSTTSSVVNAVLDGMGLSPVLRGLLSLFGGGEDDPPAPLPRYSAPSSVRVNAGFRKDSASPVGVDHGQAGESRGMTPSAASVVVNVSAMDTQSFLDRSDDIARAVKRALLESHSLNDVIAEI